MSVTTRIAALHAAVSVPVIRDEGMTETLLCASALDRWLTTHPSRCSSSAWSCAPCVPHRLCRSLATRAINSFFNVRKKLRNVGPVGSHISERDSGRFSFCLSDSNHEFPNEGLFSRREFTHTNSSSVGVDSSASEVATPARTKIIIPWQRLECMEGTGDGIVIVLKGAVA